MSEIKLCKDCKWCHRQVAFNLLIFKIHLPHDVDKCAHPSVLATDGNYLSTGDVGFSSTYCSNQRNPQFDILDGKLCKSEGKLWEARP